MRGTKKKAGRSKKSSKATAVVTAARDELELKPGEKNKDQVDKWLDEIRPDAEFNVEAYSDCFLSENLLRKLIAAHPKQGGPKLKNELRQDVKKWRKAETENLGKASISFGIREDDRDLYYLGMDRLALSVDGSKNNSGTQTLWSDAVDCKPARNVIGHTGLLAPPAKTHLNQTYRNIRDRLKKLLSQKP